METDQTEMARTWRALVEATLDEVLPAADERPAVLAEAMRYAVGTGGKRIRPLICLAAARAVGGSPEDARYPAAAIELLHNYTLVHDDLPAMDDDELRRGQPTVWKRFGEANAILAGDALLALACQTAAKAPRNVAAIVGELGEKGVGVVRGQVEDVKRNNRIIELSNDRMVESSNDRIIELSNDRMVESPNDRIIELSNDRKIGSSNDRMIESPNDRMIEFIYRHKTSDLFVAAAKMGALAGGGAPDDVARLERFALNLGLAFQYEDDLLDGDGPYSRAETERRVDETTSAAVGALEGLPGETGFLRELARKLVGRKA